MPRCRPLSPSDGPVRAVSAFETVEPARREAAGSPITPPALDATQAEVGHLLDLDATPAEVEHLLELMGGELDLVLLRGRIWASWGFCPRHDWLNAVVECELHGQPLSTAVLCEELIGRAAAQLALKWASRRTRTVGLRSSAGCLACDEVEHGATSRRASRRVVERVNARLVTVGLLTASREAWAPRSCPLCLGGNGPMCRPHMLTAPKGLDLGAVADELVQIGVRLRSLVRSMSWHGGEADAASSASWVEAVGWLDGWSYPAATLDQPRPEGP